MAYKAEVIKDSINNFGHRITTFEISFPRIVLAEFNTHRVFSRNFSSSRAIPVSKMIEQVMKDPFVPVYWGAAQKGMEASKEIEEKAEALIRWFMARNSAIIHVEELIKLGLHKQIANRILEPWMWVTGLVTSTEYDNFEHLRCSVHAQPEIKVLADMMMAAKKASNPNLLRPGEWHLPMLSASEEDLYSLKNKLKIATGRLARVSYLTHDGKREITKDIELHDSLLSNRHMSPLEHCAKNMENNRSYGNFIGWKQYRKYIPNESGTSRVIAK